ncbi:hypothetical protein [Pseudomonas sp.]|uniref:hypothetical protein n=1 Tax=Pseudomonas sp. TaxID=306 RepID=UPI00289DB540|nr:hypothetical protein [Pseudomonas sp.]
MTFSIFVSVISPLLVVGGWLFVYRNSNRIATRSEAYALVAKAVDKVLGLDKRCVEYWLADEASRENERVWVAGTLSEIHGVRTLLELLEKHHGFSEKDMLLMKLRMASTLNAEAISTLSEDLLVKQRNKQTEALNFSLHNLYGYYRAAHDSGS